MVRYTLVRRKERGRESPTMSTSQAVGGPMMLKILQLGDGVVGMSIQLVGRSLTCPQLLQNN